MFNSSNPPRWLWLPALAGLFLLSAALPVPAPAGQPGPLDRFVALPIVFVSPATLPVSDEAGLIAAITAANAADQMPRIELVAAIVLSAPLPVLDNPGAAAATIAGNGYSLDGDGRGPILAVGPGTALLVENLTIRNGAGDCGGGIYSEGLLALRRSRIIDNHAGHGGGICVVSHAAPSVLTVEDSTISGNEAAGSGGGIYAASTDAAAADLAGSVQVVAAGSLVEANTAGANGGGIFVSAGANTRSYLTVAESTLAGNRAMSGSGGAVSAMTAAGFMYATLTRSTVAFNAAANAAGVHIQGSTGRYWYSGGRADADILNSTLSGNVAAGDGGAVGNIDAPEPFPLVRTPQDPPPIGGAYLHIAYSTLTANQAHQGSGVWAGGNVSLLATIVAGNDAPGGDCGGPGWISSIGYSLDSDHSCGLSSPTDIPGVAPALRPLALNPPGITATHALEPSSPARDHIPLGAISGCAPWAANPDQRGVARPQPANGWCDIGAFEWTVGD